MVTGGFRTKQGMESAVKSGACEIVGVGDRCVQIHMRLRKCLMEKLNSFLFTRKTLSLGPWILSPSSPFRLIQALNAFGAQAWFYQQIKKEWEIINFQI